MPMEFTRECACPACNLLYVVTGTALNPANETQFTYEFRCECGSTVTAYLPGSVNRERVSVAPSG